MNSGEESTPVSSKAKIDNPDTSSDTSKKADLDDPKPRIVLTFRSEKSGAKSSSMKIVPTEEKHEEASPRRTTRSRGAKWDSEDDNDASKVVHLLSDNEGSDSSHAPVKRSTRRRSREYSDVLANAIARKEKSYNETPPPPQRLSRRIKPTAKVLANEELRIGLESQNNARLGIVTDKSEEGVRTRRSARPAQEDVGSSLPEKKKRKEVQSKKEEMIDCDEDISLKEFVDSKNSEMPEEADEGNNEEKVIEEVAEDEEEIDDDLEVINKLLEADEESQESSDEEFSCSEDVSQGEQLVTSRGRKTRRSTRLGSSYDVNDSEHSSVAPDDDDDTKAPRRRSRRLTGPKPIYLDDEERNYKPRRKRSRLQDADESKSEIDLEDNSNPAAGDEGTEATCPEDKSRVVATCFCEVNSNVYASADDLVEPVFCQAIEVVDGMRVGCSHFARKQAGVYSALIRAGPRAPYFLPCPLHHAQVTQHMCCPTCGLFCTQGIFYQCSLGHFFHLECGIPQADCKSKPGCPHCGVHSYKWQPVNRECSRVRVQMKCSNKLIFLPEQREQCTPAYQTFTSAKYIEPSPVIPPDLLPSPPVDLKQLSLQLKGGATVHNADQLYDSIVKGAAVDELLPNILSCPDINVSLPMENGGTYAHAAVRGGNLCALYCLQYAGANLERADDTPHTPLMRAVLALVDKSNNTIKKPTKELDVTNDQETMEVDETKDEPVEEKKETEQDNSEREKGKEDVIKPSDESLLKVIRYLVAAGCDVNIPGPEEMTVLHMAAQHGSEEVCSVTLSSYNVRIDVKDQGGWTPLVYAAENKHNGVVRLLLSAGADPNATDNEGNQVIHWCALAGSALCLQTILDCSPTAIHCANTHSDTPLHVAARQGHYACVVILLARGARTDIENSAGQLAVEVCGSQCQSAISLNMQMSLTLRHKFTRRTLLTSDISHGRETYPIPCVNELDDASPPEFTYVTRHVMPKPLLVDSSLPTMQGCACAESECAAECGCSVLAVQPWYSRGKLSPGFPYHEPPMLFECNETCRCDRKRCPNSVVTRLSSLGATYVRCTVMRCELGWGLTASQHISRGAPVAEYCGELLALGDADSRANDQYMFALDVKPHLLEQCHDKTQLCVDAAQYGSAARFINHSCSPNLVPVRLFTHSRDLRLPVVALFASTDIKAGDNLTFDYGDKFWSVKNKWMKCECGSPECRYPEKATEEAE